MRIAVVGATGLVGQVILDVLGERKFPIDELIPVASERSVGKRVSMDNEIWTVQSLEDALSQKPDIALFSAGSKVSKKWVPKFAEAGTTVIDNSSTWRMDKKVKLVVPEINGKKLSKKDKIIANPNCSTIQMVMALYPLHKAFGVKRVVVSTYQSVTGSGKKAVDQLENERSDRAGDRNYPHSIDLNCLPHCDDFEKNGYTKEEMKLINESRKILGEDKLKVTATAVRVPVKGGHSESVNVSFDKKFKLDKVRKLLSDFDGVSVVDDPSKNEYPMPLTAEGKDDVFVGRLRKDESKPKTLNLWVVSDNLRKGAATNTVQIAEYLVGKKLVKPKKKRKAKTKK